MIAFSVILIAAVAGSDHASAADVTDVDPGVAGKSSDPAQYAAALAAVRSNAQTSPQYAADNAIVWARALLHAGHDAEAAQACDILMPLRQTPGYRFDLMVVRGWALINSGDSAGGVGSLMEASRQPPGHPGKLAEWAMQFDGNVYGAAVAAAESGQPAFAQTLLSMCISGILAKPEDTHQIQILQTRRVQLLLAQGQSCALEALVQAKALYDVCSMEQTANSTMLVFQALRGIDPSGVSAERFKREQVAGSAELHAARPEDVTYISRPAETMLHAIRVDGSAYDARMAALGSFESYLPFVGRGNLLLLADRPAEARVAFEAAFAVADASRNDEASENLARCFRAQDGTIGRANAWVAALRPRPSRVAVASPTAPSEPASGASTSVR